MARKGRHSWEGRTPPKHRKQRQPSRPRSWARQKDWFRAVDAFRRRQRQARGAPGRGGIRGRRQARTVHIVCDLPSCGRTSEGHRRGGPYRTRGRYCSISCKQKAYRDRQRTRIAPRLCAWRKCGLEFTPKRRDALYCGGTCRTAAHRDRAAAARTSASDARPVEIAAMPEEARRVFLPPAPAVDLEHARHDKRSACSPL